MPPEPSLRAVAYVREPTEEQGQGFSPDAQREAIRRFAAENGLALVGEYCDFHSGWKRAGGRPEFQRLMMRWAWFALAAAALVAVGALAAPASGARTLSYHGTFVEIGGAIPGGRAGAPRSASSDTSRASVSPSTCAGGTASCARSPLTTEARF